MEPYGDVLKDIAERENIPLIDLYECTHSLLFSMGADKRSEMYMNPPPHDERFNDYPNFAKSMYYESGSKDNTHLNIIGAREISAFAAKELKKLSHPLAKYLK